MRTLGPIFLLVSLSVVASVAFPQPAQAGGLFYAGSGTRPLGRGAAYHVRADDPLALMYNPAKLADLEGAQFLANFNLALLDACVDPAGAVNKAVPNVEPGSDDAGVIRDRGTYKEHFRASGGRDVTRFGSVPDATNNGLRRSWIGTTMPKVCNDTALLPIPNFVFSYQFFKKPEQPKFANGKHGLTVAFGMVAPGAVAKTTWGDKDGSVRAKGHATKKQFDEAYGEDGLGKRLPAGVRPDAVCNPQTEDCSMYCDPDVPGTCDAGKQYFCDPSKYDCNRLPTPTRYMLVQQDPFAIPLTLGVGYRPLPWLAIGGAFTYQAVFFKSVVFAGQTTDGNPELDMRVENELNDWFVPIATGSVQLTPMKGLEFAGYFKWQDKIAGPTKSTITDGAYTIGGAGERLPVKSVIKAGDGLETEVPQPWEVGGGVRFALPRGGYQGDPFTPNNRQDAMTNEVFDLEFDLVFEHNSSVDQFTLRSKENALTVFQGFDYRDTEFNGSISPTDPKCQTTPGPQNAFNGCVSDSNLRFLKQMKLKRAWKDQLAYRVGGDYNVIPGILTLRAGWSLETRGVNPSYQGVDAFPARRMGLHGGLTWRIGSIDLSLAYAHLAQETITVYHNDSIAPGPALDEDLTRNEAGVRLSPLDPSARAINAGTYTVSWDVFSLGLNQRF